MCTARSEPGPNTEMYSEIRIRSMPSGMSGATDGDEVILDHLLADPRFMFKLMQRRCANFVKANAVSVAELEEQGFRGLMLHIIMRT